MLVRALAAGIEVVDGAVPDLSALLSGLAPGTAVYLCGPPTMVDSAHDCLPPSVSLQTSKGCWSRLTSWR